MKTLLPWLVGIPLRLLSGLWPLTDELLGLVWWAAEVNWLTGIASTVSIASYLFLCFFPNRFVFSGHGYLASLALMGSTLVLVLVNLSDANQIPKMLWINLGFGLAWIAVIHIIKQLHPATSKI
jgi:hypothetical protein